MIIAIAGTVKSGKTTRSLTEAGEDGRVVHTDDLSALSWSNQSLVASYCFDEENDLVIEGITVIRALRKWLARNPDGKPCDVLYFLTNEYEELTTRQKGLGKGCIKIMEEIKDELEARGVEIS